MPPCAVLLCCVVQASLDDEFQAWLASVLCPSLSDLQSFHPQRFEYGIGGIGIKTGLELRKQFSRNTRDVPNAGHWEENPFCPGVKSDLQGLGEILDGDDVSAKAHAAKDGNLRLKRLAQHGRAQGREGRQGRGVRWSRVVKLDDVHVVVVIGRLDRGANPRRIGIEEVETDLHRLLGSGVRSEPGHGELPIACGYLGLQAVEPKMASAPGGNRMEDAGIQRAIRDQRTTALLWNANELLLIRFQVV